MTVKVKFYSYFKELSGCAATTQELPVGATVGELHEKVLERFPRLAPMKRSTLIAVGVDYQEPGYVLKAGDELSLFPPVQGG